MNDNFDDTLYDRINEMLENEFNCTVPFLPPVKSKLTGNDIEICESPHTGADAYEQYYYLRSSGQSTLCDSPCTGMDIYLGLPFFAAGNEGLAYIKIYIKSALKVKTTVLDYGFVTLFAELGGYVGLLLGLSAVKVSVVINTFLVKHLTRKWVESELKAP